MKTYLALAAAMAILTGAPAFAGTTTYTSEASFDAAAPGVTTYTFPDMGEGNSPGLSYTDGPVNFSASNLEFFDDAYGTPYIADDAYNAPTDSFTISTADSALGLSLGSYFGAETYTYSVNGVLGTVSLPAPDDTTFLGFINSSGPISVSITNPSEEVDVPTFSVGGGSVSAAPEPSTWLLMFAGIGGIGLMLRRAKQISGFRFKDALSA